MEMIAALVLGAVISAEDHAQGFVYRNCADQRLQLPLLDCAELTVSWDLSAVEIRDTGEVGLAVGDPGRQFRVVNSYLVPLAVPVTDYAVIDRWEYRSNLYIKLVRGEERKFAWQRRSADTIVVVPSSSGREVDLGSRSQLAKSASLVFWFSEREGITAIALPALGRQSGEVFYCFGQPCLFAQKE